MSKANHLLIDTLKSLIEDRERDIRVLERNNLVLREENNSLKKRLSSQEGFREPVSDFFQERLN
ncbi:MAG: hypothetical protein EOM19_04230 [Candidatus Moranbacteria bacterium]|nr:hypothetical protein [Candidatus Moranbacteria bacterium]